MQVGYRGAGHLLPLFILIFFWSAGSTQSDFYLEFNLMQKRRKQRERERETDKSIERQKKKRETRQTEIKADKGRDAKSERFKSERVRKRVGETDRHTV